MKTRTIRDRKQRANGFTLIEMLVVVAIIGIIANLVIPNLLVAMQKARVQALTAEFNNFRHAVYDYNADSGYYPRDRARGRNPRELEPYIPGLNFGHRSAGYVYDWQNWVRADGTIKNAGKRLGVARGLELRFDGRWHPLLMAILRYHDGPKVVRARKVIFIIEPYKKP